MFLFSHHTYFVHLLYFGNCHDLNIRKKLNKIMKNSQNLAILI